MRFRFSLLATLTVGAAHVAGAQQQPPAGPIFTLEEVMIPMRDGARLQTVIMHPVGRTEPLPIMFTRTPYGVPEASPTAIPASLKELMADGYIFVIQNLRGRFKSEGTFLLSSQVNLADPSPRNVNETTDAYDSIDWLVKHVTNTTGKVGMYGVSYDGLTTGLALLAPHPALKAVSEQASPVDQWMNDDMHRYGALRESYAFEYAVYEQADKFKNTHFDFDVYDAYDWYLKLGPLSNINARYLHGSIPAWDSIVAHPNYDALNKREAWYTQLKGVDRSQPQRRRLLGPGRSVGSVADLSSGREERSQSHELHRRRPVVPRLVARVSRAIASASSHSADTRRRASIAKTSRRPSSATTCTARETNRRGRRRCSRPARTPGGPMTPGR